MQVHFFKKDVYKKYHSYFAGLATMIRKYKKIPLDDKKGQSLYFNAINLALREVSSSYYHKQLWAGYYYSVALSQACKELYGKYFPELSDKEKSSVWKVTEEEHINDIKSIIDNNLVKMKFITGKKVFKFLDKHFAIAYIFKEENKRLNKIAKTGRLTKTTTGFDYYKQANIDIEYLALQ